jgi:hypothetical protein
MLADAFCTSTLPSIQQATGSYNNYGRHSRCHALIGVLFDHDSKFGNQVLQFLKSSALEPMRTSIRSPWQNGVAERWVGSVRHELFFHIIPLNEYHLRRLGRDYLAFYHQDRTHIGLNKSTPAERAVEKTFSFSNPNRVHIPAGRSSPSLPLVESGLRLMRTTSDDPQPHNRVSTCPGADWIG